jgi:predicted transcriptional regulator of viral defense system
MKDFVAAVSASAARQHGLVRIADFDGGELEQLRRLARSGFLQSVFKGVYRVSGAPTTWMQLLTAAVWALGDTAAVSHAAAGRVWRLDGFTGDVIEVTVGRERRGRSIPVEIARANIPVHTTHFRLPEDTITRDGLPVTSVERTIVDLARAGVDIASLEAAIDSSIRLGYTDADRIAERIAYVRGSGRRRVARLDNLLATAGGHTFLERRFLKVLRRAGIPLPTPQVVHREGGKFLGRVDFLFEAEGVVVEVSGGRGHSTPSDRAKDAGRRNGLQRIGRIVVEYTYEQVTQREDWVVRTLRETLHERRVALRSTA